VLEFLAHLLMISTLLAPFVIWKYRQYNFQLKSPTSQHYKDLRARIEGVSTREARYTAGLDKFLAWMDRFFEHGHKGGSEPSVLSPRAFDRTLLMAVIYPIGAAFIGWLVLGNAGEMGRGLGLDDVPEILPRFSTLIFVVLVTGIWFKFKSARGWQLLVRYITLMAILLVVTPLLFRIGVPSFITIITALTLSFAFVMLSARSVKVFGIAIFCFSVAGFAAITGVSGVLSGSAVILAFAGTYVINKPKLFWLFIAILLIGCFNLAFMLPTYFPAIAGNPRAIGMLIGLILLPLVNVLFDFVSLAITRTLLRKSRDRNSLLWRLGYSGVDLALALVSMLLLMVAMVICLQAFASITGSAFVDVRAVLQDIDDNPGAGRHFWIYFALFTTLLPTMIHMVIGVSSLIMVRLPRAWAQKTLAKNTEFNRFELASLLTLQFYASIALVLLVSWGLLWLFGFAFGFSGHVLQFLLGVQAWTAAGLV